MSRRQREVPLLRASIPAWPNALRCLDLLHCDGQGLTYSPLVERNHRLRSILPKDSQSVLFSDYVEAAGEKSLPLACKRDIESIVAKHKFGPYLQASAQWLKIRNRKYSQWAGREKFFEREREVDPDISIWDSCAIACEHSASPHSS